MKTVLVLTLLAAIAIYLLLENEAVQTAVTEEVGGLLPIDETGVPDYPNDKVRALAIAIAKAEGFFNPVEIGKFIQNRPQRDHNPGDITDSSERAITKDGPLNVYQNDNDGWMDLFEKVDRLLSGNSHTFHLSDSFSEFGQTWTGGDHPTSWSTTVVEYLSKLGVQLTTDNTLEDYANA